MTLEKAQLQEIDTKPTATPKRIGDPVDVQVNPTSLRLALTNNTDVGKALSRPSTTYQGASSSTLSFDLVMDTADQGTTDAPVDVRSLTARLEYFLLPKKGDQKGAPPRVQFSYGSLTVAGVMSGLNLEFDLFSSGGVPLRAKASVTIKEQKPEFDANLLGPGANSGAGATSPNAPAGAGTSGASPPADRTGTAIGGESAADFAARMGLDPSTWKSFSAGIANPLSLDAGLQIDFSSSASSAAGLGTQSAATAGLSAGGGALDTTTPPVESLSGAGLTAAGGVNQAISQRNQALSASAAAGLRSAFGASPPATAASAAGTSAATSATGASRGGAPSGPAGGGAGSPPGISGIGGIAGNDPRAAAFGFGVPLRPLVALPDRAAVAIVHDTPRGQSWPPPGTLGMTPAGGAASASSSGACSCSPGAGSASGGAGAGAASGRAGCGCGCGGR
jgi:hypothetical protein